MTSKYNKKKKKAAEEKRKKLLAEKKKKKLEALKKKKKLEALKKKKNKQQQKNNRYNKNKKVNQKNNYKNRNESVLSETEKKMKILKQKEEILKLKEKVMKEKMLEEKRKKKEAEKKLKKIVHEKNEEMKTRLKLLKKKEEEIKKREKIVKLNEEEILEGKIPSNGKKKKVHKKIIFNVMGAVEKVVVDSKIKSVNKKNQKFIQDGNTAGFQEEDTNHPEEESSSTTTTTTEIVLPKFDPKTSIGRKIKVSICTFNVNERVIENPKDLFPILQIECKPEIIAVGLQEVDMSALSIISSATKNKNSVSWEHKLTETFQLLKQQNSISYTKLASQCLVGIFIIVYVRSERIQYIKDVRTEKIACGVVGMLGNKGGVAIRFDLFYASFCFINSHFEAHKQNVEKRNQHFKILDHGFNFNGNPNTYNCKNHDYCFWFGDLNYRIMLNYDSCVKKISCSNSSSTQQKTTGNLRQLLAYDQLTLEKIKGECFDEYHEPKITFKPTYKFDVGSVGDYDTSEKKRVPSYCDRVLFKVKKERTLKSIGYRMFEDIIISDHKPVSALFEVVVMVPKDSSTIKKRRLKKNEIILKNRRLRRQQQQQQENELQQRQIEIRKSSGKVKTVSSKDNNKNQGGRGNVGRQGSRRVSGRKRQGRTSSSSKKKNSVHLRKHNFQKKKSNSSINLSTRRRRKRSYNNSNNNNSSSSKRRSRSAERRRKRRRKRGSSNSSLIHGRKMSLQVSQMKRISSNRKKKKKKKSIKKNKKKKKNSKKLEESDDDDNDTTTTTTTTTITSKKKENKKDEKKKKKKRNFFGFQVSSNNDALSTQLAGLNIPIDDGFDDDDEDY